MDYQPGTIYTRKIVDDSPIVGAERGLSREQADEQGLLLVDAATAYRMLEDAINEYGEDHVVTDCAYYRMVTAAGGKEFTTPGCIVGVGLYQFDIDLPSVIELYQNNTVIYSLVQAGVFDKVAVFTETGLRILCEAQDEQDGGIDWGNVMYRVKRSLQRDGILIYEPVKVATPPHVPAAALVNA